MRFRLSFFVASLCLLVSSALCAQVVPGLPTKNAQLALDALRATAPSMTLLEHEGFGTAEALFHLDVAVPGATREEKARTFLEVYGAVVGKTDAVELLHTSTRRMPSGHTFVRFAELHAGTPVYTADVVVWLNAEDRVDTVLSGLIPPTGDEASEATLTHEAAFDALEALARSGQLNIGVVDPSEQLARTHLVYLPMAATLRLAYLIDVPEVSAIDGRIAFVDAQTGAILSVFDTTRQLDQANVFIPNPGPNGVGNATEVRTLLHHEDAQGTGFLSGSLVNSYNCVNQGETISTFMGNITICSEVQTASADANGDYLHDPVWPSNPAIEPVSGERLNDVDPFAEVHMFYHVNSVYAAFQSLGFELLKQVPLRAVVNFRIPDFQDLTGGKLVPMDNAAFFQAGPIIPGIYERNEDSIIFGQGQSVDYSYDGDVIYHEFTHAVIYSTSNLQFTNFDSIGLDLAPGDMHEALSDYFAATFTNDSVIGNYAGGTVGIRDIGLDKVCPDNMIGEAHDDGSHLSGALWDLRNDLVANQGATLDQFDGAIYEAVAGLPQLATHPMTGNVVRNTLAAIDPAWGTAAQAIFEERMVIGCDRVVDLSVMRPLLYIYGPEAIAMSPWVPSAIQFKVTVPEGHDSVRIGWLNPNQGGFMGAMPEFRVVGRAGQPLRFSYINQMGQSTVSADSSLDAKETRNGTEAVPVGFGQTQNVPKFEATFNGLLPGDYYFSLVTEAGGQGQVMKIRSETFEAAPILEEAEAEQDVAAEPTEDTAIAEPAEDTSADASVDAEANEDTAAVEELVGEKTVEEGCGCRVTRDTRSELPLTALFALGAGLFLVVRRRRH